MLLFNVNLIKMEQNLKVTDVRYFKTNRGVGYQCKTNYDGVQILNDGMGSTTYLSGKYNIIKHLQHIHETELERLIDIYEKQKKGIHFLF